MGTTSRPTRKVTRRIISISVADTGSYTRDCSLVVLLGEAGTNRRRGLASPFFLPSASSSFLTISLPRCQPPPSPLSLLNGFIVPCHFQRKRIEIIWNRRSIVTYDALLSVNYLLIILFILAATTPLLSTEQGQRGFPLKITQQYPRQKWICIDLCTMFVTCHVNVAQNVNRSMRYKLASKHILKHEKCMYTYIYYGQK